MDGHGTHTASTAAGSFVKGANFYGLAKGNARGGVPSARIAAYKVCASSCEEHSILAAFDDAIADGVDILSVSLASEFALEPSTDSIAIASFHAMKQGVLTVQSAGNTGNLPTSVASVAPWLFTVAASTTDRRIIDKITLGNGKTIIVRILLFFVPELVINLDKNDLKICFITESLHQIFFMQSLVLCGTG